LRLGEQVAFSSTSRPVASLKATGGVRA